MKTFQSFLALCVTTYAGALFAATATPTEMSCTDFKWTPEAAERFKDFQGACEAIVDINGHTYGKFSAVVRRASASGVTLNLTQTDHTFTVKPGSDLRVLVGSQRVRPRDLQRGQKISVYLSTDQFAQPNVTEVAMLPAEATEAEPVAVPAVETAALPTTASLLPMLALIGGVLLGLGLITRRIGRRWA